MQLFEHCVCVSLLSATFCALSVYTYTYISKGNSISMWWLGTSFWYYKFLLCQCLYLLMIAWSWMQERGFLSLSTALLSSSILRLEGGHAMEIFMDVTSSIEAVILSFLFCRSGWLELTNAHRYCWIYYQKQAKKKK